MTTLDVLDQLHGWLAGILQLESEEYVFDVLPEALPRAVALSVTGAAVSAPEGGLTEFTVRLLVRRPSALELLRDTDVLLGEIPFFGRDGIVSAVARRVEFREEECGGRRSHVAEMEIEAAFV